ncbi:hypothetical protein AAC387_Pa01g1702 [Persea americana]
MESEQPASLIWHSRRTIYMIKEEGKSVSNLIFSSASLEDEKEDDKKGFNNHLKIGKSFVLPQALGQGKGHTRSICSIKDLCKSGDKTPISFSQVLTQSAKRVAK